MCLFVQCKPQHRPDHVRRVIKRQCTTLRKNFSEVIHAFDGARHPMKSVAREERDKKINDAKQLKETLENIAANEVTDDHRTKYVKYMKDLTHPDACVTNDLVQFMREDSMPLQFEVSEAK